MMAAALASGCGSTGSSNSGGFAGGFSNGAQQQAQLSVLNTVQASVLQASLAQSLGGLLAGAKFMAPFATGFRTFDPSIEVDIAGNYKLTRTPLADGKFRIDIYNQEKTRLLASAIAEPAVQTATGYSVQVTLGDTRVVIDGGASTSRGTYSFYGVVGTAVLSFDRDGVLQGVALSNIQQYGQTLRFGTVSGNLTRSGDHLTGRLGYGVNDSGFATIDALYDSVGAFGGLDMFNDLLDGQGQAFLDRNFNAGGTFSPLDDPVFSSPLSPVSLGNGLAAPNNDRYVSYTVVNGIMTVTTPALPPATSPTVQSFDLLNAQASGAGFPPTPLPAGARLIVQAGPSGPVAVGTRLSITVYAVDSAGKAVPFTTNGFQLTSSNAQVVRVSDGFRAEALSAGTATLTLNDPTSGQSGTVQVTVQGAGATGTGFVYLSDTGNSRLVRFRFNPANPALPTERTEISTGHAPLGLLISADKSTLFAENLDNTVQVFSINQSNGNLTERSATALGVGNLAQGQLDPTLYYGSTGGGDGNPNQVKEFRFNSSNGTLTFTRNLREGSSSRVVPGLINAGQYLYASFQNKILSIDAATATTREVTMGAGEIVSDLAVTRLSSGANTLQVLITRNVSGGVREGTLRSFPLNNDGTLNTPASRNITVQPFGGSLTISGDRAYNGVFSDSFLINGVQLGLTSLTHLAGQPYPISGTPAWMAAQGNLLFVATNPENKLETLLIAGDGSLSTLGAVNVGGSPTNIKVVVLP
ncbi:hypothetical protein ABS71_02150 [bacterium SCN 62-11]|nr:MAG: hypothetical protein ABS71_02150 [bacterium SCN 62-11]